MLRPRSRLLFGDDVPKSALRLSGANKSLVGGTLVEGRTSSATYIDSADGLLKTAAANVPVWENGGLRHEGQATNNPTHSYEFRPFGAGGNTYVLDAIGPDGVTSCYRISVVGSRQFINYALDNGSTDFALWIKTTDASHAATLILKNNATDTVKGSKEINFTNTWQRVSVTGITNGATPGCRAEITSTVVNDCYFGEFITLDGLSSYVPTTTAAVTRATCALSIPLVLNQNFYQKSAIVMRVRAKHANSATAKSWLTPSTTAEGLIDNGSGALTFVDSAANTATANLTSWAADTIILVAIVTDNVTGLMSLSASKDNGATWIDSANTAFAGLTVGANWLLFSGNTQVFECLGWNVIKSNKGFAQMKAYAKNNILRLTQ
jgi:hypothetical protein